MANFTATQKREHAVLTKIQNELSFFADRKVMNVASSAPTSVPLAFNLDAFELVDGDIDFTPAKMQAPQANTSDCAPAPMPFGESDGAAPQSLEWFSRLLQNAARAQ
jgi:hypothetical protein